MAYEYVDANLKYPQGFTAEEWYENEPSDDPSGEADEIERGVIMVRLSHPLNTDGAVAYGTPDELIRWAERIVEIARKQLYQQ